MGWLLAIFGAIALLAFMLKSSKSSAPHARAAADLQCAPAADCSPVSGMFCTPKQAYGEERLSKAYWLVMSELKGEGLTLNTLAALEPAFIDALDDSKRAGQLLADVFRGIDWDWPRWHGFAKRNGYSSVSDIAADAQAQSLNALLNKALKADLVALGASLNIALPKSNSKSEMINSLMALPPEQFGTWVESARLNRHATEADKLHRDMGRFVAVRISYLANQEQHYEQCTDPEVLILHPYWRFICPNDMPTPAPKRCRDLDQKVLPAAQAMKKFPKIPCDRLDCQCRFTTQRRLDGDDF